MTRKYLFSHQVHNQNRLNIFIFIFISSFLESIMPPDILQPELALSRKGQIIWYLTDLLHVGWIILLGFCGQIFFYKNNQNQKFYILVFFPKNKNRQLCKNDSRASLKKFLQK